MGSQSGIWYARALGCKIGDEVHLDAMPPVTGLAVIGSGSSIEYEVDLAGHWLDGDTLSIGRITIGANCRVGTRSTLSGGAVLEDGSEVEAGTCVDGTVPAGERWAGSQMQPVGLAGDGWPTTEPVAPRHPAVRWLYPISLVGLALMPIASVLPGAVLAHDWQVQELSDLDDVLWVLAGWAPVFVVLSVLSFLCLTVLGVRSLSRFLVPGFHSVQGTAAWAAWLSNLLLAKSLVSVYPIYASIITPLWMRMLGAPGWKTWRFCTMETIPHLTSIGDRSFLADHSMVYPTGGGVATSGGIKRW